MSDVLQTEETTAATLAEPQAAEITPPAPGPGSMIVFESVTKVYEPDVTALREVDDRPAAAEGARAHAGPHRRRRAGPDAPAALEGAAAAAQCRLCLPGLQAAAVAHGGGERRGRAEGAGREHGVDPAQGAGGDEHGRARAQDELASRRALRRRAAARLDRARV